MERNIDDPEELLEFFQIHAPLSIRAKEKKQVLKMFAQAMMDRMMQGDVRYGPAKKSQHYMTRLIMEVKAYKLTGNAEQLFNIANYCVLEWMCPEHPKHHFNPLAKSVTRTKNASGKKTKL